MNSDEFPRSDDPATAPDSADERSDADSDAEYDPGETLGRAMNLGCSLILLAFALVSCGFIASVLALHR